MPCAHCRPRKFLSTRSYTSCNHTDHTRPADWKPVNETANRFSTRSKRPPNRKQTAGSRMHHHTNAQIACNQTDHTLETNLSKILRSACVDPLEVAAIRIASYPKPSNVSTDHTACHGQSPFAVPGSHSSAVNGTNSYN